MRQLNGPEFKKQGDASSSQIDTPCAKVGSILDTKAFWQSFLVCYCSSDVILRLIFAGSYLKYYSMC